MLYELELIDDAFCDAYAEQNFSALSQAIDRLHEWREKYALTYDPSWGPGN